MHIMKFSIIYLHIGFKGQPRNVIRGRIERASFLCSECHVAVIVRGAMGRSVAFDCGIFLFIFNYFLAFLNSRTT